MLQGTLLNYIISYLIISYLIISYHIISYHIMQNLQLNILMLTSTPSQMAVSIGLCRLLNLDHNMATTVACLLCAPLGGKINILSLLRVGSDPYSSSVRESLRGIPGEYVTSSDTDLLVTNCFMLWMT